MALRNLLLHLPTLQICINVRCCTNVAWRLVLFNAKKKKKKQRLCPSLKHLAEESQTFTLLKHMKE